MLLCVSVIFTMYDFDETSMLTVDEMVLAFRSTLSGLSKLSKIDPPTEAEIEQIVVQGFDGMKAAVGNNNKEFEASEYPGIDRDSFVRFCLNTPEILSWIEYFDDLEEHELESTNRKPIPRAKPSHLDRIPNEDCNMNPTTGGLGRLEYERKGPAKEFVPKQKWQNTVPLLAPPRIPDQARDMPTQLFKLEWAYGYNAHSSRQNLFYTAKGHIVYPAGCVCVVQDVYQHSQRFFVEHSDLIVSMKLFNTPQGNTIVATGEVGKRPAIHVWDAETLMPISTLRGFHRNGVSQLDFSPDRTKLATLGMDTYHSVAVYNWRTAERIWASRSTVDLVHDLRFLSNEQLATCGVDHIYFWKETKRGTYQRYRGFFGVAVKPEPLWSVAMVGSNVITGSESGMIYVWEGRNLISSVKGHTGTIMACYVVDQGQGQGLVTACSNGKIQLWNEKLELGATFNALSLGAVDAAIVSICWDTLASRILVGFRSCEIFEMDATEGRNAHDSSVVSGHFSPRVCGLAPHPMIPKLFCTVGDDRSVRVYDSEARKLLRVSMLDTMGHCCAYSPDGQLILIGLGSGVEFKEERKEGAYVVLNEQDLTLVREARDSKFLITDCKYSPDGALMALSSDDGSIYIYNADDYAARARCRGHTGKVEHVDFSHNGKFLMSNGSNGELLFWDAEKGELQPPKSLKEMLWDTNSCVYSYATQGIWGVYDDGVYCNASCRSNSRELIACTDNFGRVRVYNAPVVKEDANFIQLNAHSANTMNCRFACDDSRLFTTGGKDGCVFQWRIANPDVQDYEELKQDDSVQLSQAMELRCDRKFFDKMTTYENVINDRPIALCEVEEGIVDVTQLHPWQRTIVAPSRVPTEDNSEPPDALELEFVYGYTCDRSRKSVFYSRGGELAFFNANVAVLMKQKQRTQRFYQEHTATITSMAIHPTEHVIATGEMGEVATIRCWSSETLETIVLLSGFHRRAVTHLCFSQDGKQLASMGQDQYHSIAVYDWRNQNILSHTRGISVNSFALEFNPTGDCLVQAGNEILRIWEINNRNMLYQDALLGSRAKRQGFLSIGWIGNNPVVGTADGNLYRFVGRQLDTIVQAHSDAVNAIASSNYGICSASADRFVKIWTHALECRLVVDCKSLGSSSPNIRCVSWDADLFRLLIGTNNGEIFELSSGDGENLHGGPLLEGHAGEELWGLAVNPTKDEFCTVGDDFKLRVWDVITHRALNTVALELPARCCCYSPDGKNIAIGYGCPQKVTARQYDGKWVILSAEDFQVMHEARDSVKWLTEIKYSPSGGFIAIGSFDNKIYVYNVAEGYSCCATITRHQSFIRSLDFSEQSDWLQSNCAAYELMFFEADTGLFIPAPSRLRDVVWSTQNCMMGWAVQGIWQPQKDGTDITACECNLFRAGNGPVVVSGDNYGRIKLWRYPCTSNAANSKTYKAGSGQITRLRFAAGDSMLLSLTGADKAIFQWRHVRDRGDEVGHNVIDARHQIEEDDDDVLQFFGIAADDASEVTKDLTSLIWGRPWLASMVAPSDPKVSSSNAPEFRLEKSHVFGQQVEIARSSARFNIDGDIISPASKYVCLYNKKKNQQIYYEGHSNEISCVAVSKDGKLAASAEKSNRPTIHIWDAVTCELISILPMLHRRGVASIQFSGDRKRIVSVGKDKDHSIAVWQSPSGAWTDGAILAWSRGDVSPVLFCGFYDDCPMGRFALASGGRFHQKFWEINGRCLNAYYPECDVKQKLSTLLCGMAVKHLFVSGSTNGHLFVWEGRKLMRKIRAHDLAVTSVWACDCAVLSASKDGTIKQWTAEVEHVRSFSLRDADVPPLLSSIRSVHGALSLEQDSLTRVVVATAAGELYEVAARSGSICLVSEAHYTGELWGLCVNPVDPDLFATAGDDRTIRVWSVSARRVLRKAALDCTSRCIGWSPNGKLIVVGMGGLADGKRQRKDGAFLILDANTLKPIFEGR
jgi:microtubule-associated protein-like 6